MKLADTNYDNAETGCCARLDHSTWDEKTLTWEDKPFLRDRIHSFLHIPLNFGSVVTRGNAMIERASAYPADPLCLTGEVSPWRSEVYMAVEGDVSGATVETMSGTFLTKAFEGPYRQAGRWTEEMHEYVRAKGHEVEAMYYYYATCPKCGKAFGKNEVVLFAKVA